MGLRERKKRETRARILRVSRKIFLEKGYADTTVDEVADKAQIGIGTLYNYFKSKAEIFLAIMSEEIALDEEGSLLFEHDLENDVAGIVTNYIWKHFGVAKAMGKRLWKELFSVMLSAAKNENVLFNGIAKLDYRFIGSLDDLLKTLKKEGKLPSVFDTGEASYAIYSVLMFQFMLYVYSADMTGDDLTLNVEKQVRFIFDGKCNAV